MSESATRMARLRLHGLCLPGLRPRRPIPEPRHQCGRGAVPAAHRRLWVGRLGDDQSEGRARIARLRSLQQLWRVNTLARPTLHELRCGVAGG